MIGYSEGTIHIPGSDDGYLTIVGSTRKHPHLMTDYADHPRILVDLGGKLKSTAAGRYQILMRNYDAYKLQLGLPDFSPESQDKIAIQLIYECRAMATIERGEFARAVKQCASRWASLPGSKYGQPTNEIDGLIAVYRTCGGVVA
jgi:muramidase (phage lysozyme)